MSKSTKPAKGKSSKATKPAKGKAKSKAAEAEIDARAKAAPAGKASKVGKPSKAELRHLEHVRKVKEAAETVADKSRPKRERKAAARFLDEAHAATAVRAGSKALAGHEAASAAASGKAAAEPVGAPGSARAADALEGESEVEYQHRKLAERTAAEAEATPPAEVLEVETEHGREFVAGAASSLESHGIVAAVEPAVVERDWLDRPIVAFVNDKGEVKRKGYTRVTTYIDCLEDKSALDKWKTRTLLEGVALDLDPYRADGELDLADSLIGRARRLSNEHDKALKRIAKRQDKGELVLGQFGLLREEADKAWKDGLNELVELGLDLGGVHERANKGTDLHALTERYDRGELTLDSEELTDVDRADLKAYADKMAELGIEHVAQEQFVVIDELGVGGTLDRMALYKPKGAGRRVRVVADIKTGRIDYSAGKIGMQVLTYARGKAIDPEVEDGTGRIDLKASKTVGLLIHLPQGEARCEVYELDLTLAARGLRLAGEVRDWRNAGKRTYNVKAPLVPEVAR